MNIKNKIKSIVNNHMDCSNDSFFKEKIITMNIVMLIMGIVVFSFAVLRFIQENYTQAIADFIMTAIIISSYIALYRHHNYLRFISRILIFFAVLTSFTLIIFNPDVETRFSWIGICVYLMFFLLDLKEGIRWITGMILILVVLYITNVIKLELSEFIIFFVATSLLAFLLSRYEKIKQKSEKQFLRHNKELVDALRTKSDFLANMSHEIRTPLNALIGFVDILKEGESDIQRQKYFDIINNSGQDLLTIINDILDFSKIESGKLEIEYVPINPIIPFKDAQLLFFEKAKERDIKLKLSINSEFPKYVFGDAVRIKQIISNLISNAIKFTPEHGNVSIGLNYDNNALHCSVKDSGIGIDKKNQSKIFDSFSQEDSSTTRKYGGTGLGLSISSKLVSLLGGELKLKSEIGIGSEFYFSIPLEIADEIKEEKVQIDEHKLEGHVLVVEDNKSNQLFMEVILKKMDLTFEIVNNGEEAVELFKISKFDLILMDENMPIMNGIEATKRILDIEKENNLTHTPIIAITANAIKGDRDRFIEAGMDEYIVKPVNKKKLNDVLNRFL